MWRMGLAVVFTFRLFAQPQAPLQIMPLADLRPDMRGTARTVFRGLAPEEFPVVILGVLHASGPGQNLILARLLTPRLELTGVMQGMSGSPVYVDGKLIGAIAFAFPFAKEPIAGVRPIEEMLSIPTDSLAGAPLRPDLTLASNDLFPTPAPLGHSDAPTAVLTPITFSGLTRAALDHFSASWRKLGFSVQQGTGGNKPAEPSGSITAGDMLSVQLLRGDITAGADGTVTHRAGNRIYAFGHRFLAAGPVDFPFAKAEVVTPLPNYNTSFKISQGLAPVGAITLDGDAGVVGEIGRIPKMAPLVIAMKQGNLAKTYRTEMVRHTLLSPLLLQMAVFTALDHHMRSAGPASVDIFGSIRFGANLPPLKISGRYAGDANLPLMASLGASIPLAYVSQQMSEQLLPESIEVSAVASPTRDQWTLESLTLSRRTAKPGEAVTLSLKLSSATKSQVVNEIFHVPTWLTAGETLTITAMDALTANLLDFRPFYQPGGPTFQSAGELIETLNRLHPAGHLYLRVLRTSATYQSGVRELSNVPSSIGTLLGRAQGQYTPVYQSRLLDKEIVLSAGVASGSKTTSLEIEK